MKHPMKHPMNTEAMQESFQDLDSWPPEKILEAIIDANARAAQAVKEALPELTRAAMGLERCLAHGGRLIYAGAGTSGRLALLDSAELYPTFGFDTVEVLIAGGRDAWGQAKEGAEDDEAAAAGEMQALTPTPTDAVIGLAASGRTPYTLVALRVAKEAGAFTVGIANNPGAPLLTAADVGIFLDTGPEVLAGSTRLAAGTAQKIALNALSTAVLVRLGGAYGNRMVGMKALNQKLQGRAVTMVVDATGAPEDDAERALKESGWAIREAIVMLKLKLPLAEAKARLAQKNNRVRDVLEER